MKSTESHESIKMTSLGLTEGDDIFLACRKGDLQRVRLLAEQKTFNMEARDNLGSTPLHYACLCGHADLISFLLTAGAIPPKSANNKKRR